MLKAKALCAVNGNTALEVRSLMLVDSFISNSKAECIEYFCDYYVLCNLNNNRLCEKVTKDSCYQENNYYGHVAVPQLVICGESYEHCVKMNQYLRNRGLINEKDSLLYTDDLLYVQGTLQDLYELDEEGHRTWCSFPARQIVTDMERGEK